MRKTLFILSLITGIFSASINLIAQDKVDKPFEMNISGDGHPAHGFQLTPIGVSYGNRFFGFAELGMGWMFYPARAGIGIRF